MLAHCLLAFSQTQKPGIEPSGLQRPLCICPVFFMVLPFSISEATGTFPTLPPITALIQHLPWYVLQSDAVCLSYVMVLQAMRHDHCISPPKLLTSPVHLLIRDRSHCMAENSACIKQQRPLCLAQMQLVCVMPNLLPKYDKMIDTHSAFQLLSVRTPVECKRARCVPTELLSS